MPLKLCGLDQFVSEHQLSFPDIIKLDVQGFELEVLKSGVRPLAHARCVIAEVCFKEFYVGQCRFDEVVAFLSANELYTYALGVRTPRGKALLQADVLFVRPI